MNKKNLIIGVCVAVVSFVVFNDRKPRIIYMDYQATTPVDKRVVDEMKPYLSEHFANPSSLIHNEGRIAMNAVKLAKKQVADVIGADEDEIIFTSGATESDNLALKGIFEERSLKNHLITVSTEHPAILDTAKYLETKGVKVTILKPKENGIIDLKELEKAITKNTALISIMAVNNQTGVIQPLKEIGEIAKKHGIIFHTDAAQGFGKADMNVNEMNIGMMSVSGHKIFGPKGIGALYVRKDVQEKLKPMMHGGGQQNGLRSGTFPTQLIVGLGKAAELMHVEKAKSEKHQKELYSILTTEILKTPNTYLIGDPENKYFGVAKIGFKDIKAAKQIFDLMPDVMLSSTSACSSGIDNLHNASDISSKGIAEGGQHAEIRFAISKFTTKREVMVVIKKLKHAIKLINNH